MKRIFLYTTVLLIAATSCTKELVQNPYNAINATEAFNTPADFTNAIRGMYSGFKNSSYYGGQDAGGFNSTPDIMSDNLILAQLGRKSQQDFFNFKFAGNDTWSLWGNAYTVILRSNYILTNIAKLSDGTFKNNTQGEALAVRGLAHFDLLRLYAKSYASASATDLGVPYVTTTDAFNKPSRTPVKQAYDLAVQDLVQAETLISTDNGVGRLNKAAVEALLSRIYLYRGEWQKSADAATKAIANVPAANALASSTDFPKIWTDATEKDVLFKVKILDDDAIPIGVAYGQSSNGSTKPEYVVDYGFFTQFAANDVRLSAYIGQTTYSGVKYNYIKKYFGRATGNLNVVDYKVIRMGEVYLNRAEAYYNLGQTVNALADLNTLRANRYTGFVAGAETGTALYNAILLERRFELAFEGSRFFDLKRLGLPVQRSNFGDQADGTGVAAAVKTVPANSNLFQLPIPQSEIDANPNIQQNP